MVLLNSLALLAPLKQASVFAELIQHVLSDAEGVTFNVQTSADWFNALGASRYSL